MTHDNGAPVWLAIPKQPQRQDSTQEQLNDLRLVAIHLGMYDALDHLQRLDLAMRLDLKPLPGESEADIQMDRWRIG